MSDRMPVIFVSHGAPTLLIDGTDAEKFFRELSGSFPKPKGILVVSGHWEEERFTVSTIKKQETIYDFSGFPDELYKYKYEPDGAPELADKVRKLLSEAGIETDVVDRGLDHGAWVPLVCMYPEADIPVTQLSLKRGGTPEEYVQAGEALRPLRDEGYLILTSGSSTHNLSDFGKYALKSVVADYALDFDSWLENVVTAGDTEALKNYRAEAPEAEKNHPTDDHFSPMLVAAGASYDSKGMKLHSEFVYGFLSLAAYRWDS